MIAVAMQILIRIRRRWQLLKLLEILLFAISPAFLIHAIFNLWSLTVPFFLGLATILFLIYKPWKITLEDICSFIDYNFGLVEYSSSLLLQPKAELSSLAGLQQEKMIRHLNEIARAIKRPNYLTPAAISSVLALALALLLNNYFGDAALDFIPGTKKELLNFEAAVNDTTNFEMPILEEQQLTISYPAYTKLPSQSVTTPNIQVLEGSTVSWVIKFNSQIDSVFFEFEGDSYPMYSNNGYYKYKHSFANPIIYNFKFITAGRTYISELAAVEVTKDRKPIIAVEGLRAYTSFEIEEDKMLEFKASIKDDYGLADIRIIATVSKGSGEAVKFRELELNFDNRLVEGTKSATLNKILDLMTLEMEAGDELYFYIEASDQKAPKSNTARSETFFAAIRDTLQNTFAVEGTLGADLMPDYFRSQRQLIIDTEQLIADKPKISEKQFNSTSNELGFDQKALRLKYGEFMGDETETTAAVAPDESGEQDADGEDPLAEFTHDHDGDNEHNLVEEGQQDQEHKDPLSAYLHNHEDPEAATIFTESLRSKLKRAMAEMWDAELYLRLYEPDKSLVYQYRALRLIQEIKNSARIYVHRIGFDPPPIKEEVRLSGDLESISSYRQRHELAEKEKYPFIRKAIICLGRLEDRESITQRDRELFNGAGAELSQLALEQPSRYLVVLQQLKWLSETNSDIEVDLGRLQHGLIDALPKRKSAPQKRKLPLGEINELFLNEMMSDE